MTGGAGLTAAVLAVTTDYDNWGMIIAGWGLGLAAIGVFTWRMLARGRRLADQVPDEETPWR
jgi:hypothetical protein